MISSVDRNNLNKKTMSAKEQISKEIMEAYIFLRTNNMTIPSETLEFIKDSSLKALKVAINYTPGCETFDCGDNRVSGDLKCLEQCARCKECYN